jgi:hypothetical protein
MYGPPVAPACVFAFGVPALGQVTLQPPCPHATLQLGHFQTFTELSANIDNSSLFPFSRTRKVITSVRDSWLVVISSMLVMCFKLLQYPIWLSRYGRVDSKNATTIYNTEASIVPEPVLNHLAPIAGVLANQDAQGGFQLFCSPQALTLPGSCTCVCEL